MTANTIMEKKTKNITVQFQDQKSRNLSLITSYISITI